MRRVLRSPLAWMAVGELLVVGALAGVAWNLVSSAGHAAVAAPVLQPPDAAGFDQQSPVPEIPRLGTQSDRGPLPGLNTESAFWRGRLAELNADQILLEQLEWRIVHGAEDAVKHYLETVVLPAVRRAEEAGGEPVG